MCNILDYCVLYVTRVELSWQFKSIVIQYSVFFICDSLHDTFTFIEWMDIGHIYLVSSVQCLVFGIWYLLIALFFSWSKTQNKVSMPIIESSSMIYETSVVSEVKSPCKLHSITRTQPVSLSLSLSLTNKHTAISHL